MLVFIPSALLTLYTVKMSRRLSEFLDTLSGEALAAAEKWRAFKRIWR